MASATSAILNLKSLFESHDYENIVLWALDDTNSITTDEHAEITQWIQQGVLEKFTEHQKTYLTFLFRQRLITVIPSPILPSPNQSDPSSLESTAHKTQTTAQVSAVSPVASTIQTTSTQQIPETVQKKPLSQEDCIRAAQRKAEAEKEMLANRWEMLQNSTAQAEELNQLFEGGKAEVPSRYRNIICPQRTCVRGNKLHANYIDLVPCIASQAPIGTNEGIANFWEAVIEYTDCIVNLTNREDLQNNKTADYWKSIAPRITITPLTNDQIKPPAWVLECAQYLPVSCYQVEVKTHQRSITKPVWHIKYEEWPDGKVVSLEELIKIEQALRNVPRPLIHCSAGVGRTGTVITALKLRKLAAEGQLSIANTIPSVLKVIWQGRVQRGPKFVTEPEQFTLLVQFAYYLILHRQSMV